MNVCMHECGHVFVYMHFCMHPCMIARIYVHCMHMCICACKHLHICRPILHLRQLTRIGLYDSLTVLDRHDLRQVEIVPLAVSEFSIHAGTCL